MLDRGPLVAALGEKALAASSIWSRRCAWSRRLCFVVALTPPLPELAIR